MREIVIDSSASGLGPVTKEHGKKVSGSLTCWEFWTS